MSSKNKDLEPTRAGKVRRAQRPPSLFRCVQYRFRYDDVGCTYLDDLASTDVVGTQDWYLPDLQLWWTGHYRQYLETDFLGLACPNSGLFFCQAPVCHVGRCRDSFWAYVQLSPDLAKIVPAPCIDCTANNLIKPDEQRLLWR